MAKETKYSIKDLKKAFPDDDACLEFMFDILHSRKCSCGGKYSRIKGRKQYQCSMCRYQISPCAGTIFHKSETPLTSWFHAIWIFSNAKSGISTKEMERHLGVTYKCAWRILMQIRKAVARTDGTLRDVVEMDAGYIGGIGKKNKIRMENKVPVIVAIQRNGEIRAEVVKNVSAETHQRFLEKHVASGSTILTDGASWKSGSLYDRYRVQHNKGEFVRGDVHINRVETFFSHLKRSLRGTHKSVSPEHLQSYLDGFVFHYNMRYSDRHRFDALVGAVLQSSE